MKISIVIPAYNEERYLGACLGSLVAQDFPEPFEIIVVDNDSTDRTAAIAASFDVRVLTETRRGVCAARQAGTAVVRGQIVVSADADTIYPSNWLSTIWQTFADVPDAVAVTGAVTFVDAPWWVRLTAVTFFGVSRRFFIRTGRVNYMSGCNTAFRKEAWSGYKTDLTQGGDEFDLLQQLSARGPIVFQQNMRVRTSSRRFNRGFAYSLFVTVLWYYFVNYTVGRVTGRSPFGSYPPIRAELVRQSPVRGLVRSVVVAAMITASVATLIHPAAAHQIMKQTGARLESLAGKIQHLGSG